MKTKEKTICSIHINKKKGLNLYKIILLVEKLYFFKISRFCLYLYLYVTYLTLNTDILFYLANLKYN